MGTDAGTDTSEKAPIGRRTSLTQLDTWLEAMEGETLCLTGKVTDCWQPVDGAQENASFLLKDLSTEADASSFVFSGDSAETTDNLSQISGSADADQMSVLISSQKTISQINEMQEIFGKNASTLCYLQEDEALPKAGSYVRVFGEVSPFLQATNPGEFDAAAYYRRKDCLFALRKTKITAQTKNYGRLEEFLSQLRYESEALFRKLLGEKNGATASAMVLGRKKGMDSEVKALYQGAGISHLLAISGLHLSLIGAGLFGLLKKVRLPVTLSAGISTWILIAYAQLTGMGISTRRALVMFLLFLAAGLLKRTPDLPTSLAVAALLLLVPKPQRILDAGFQLSFSAVIGIAVMIPVLQDGWEDAACSRRVGNRVTDGVAGWNFARTVIARACRLLRKNILAGLGITMTMLPFLLIHFYEWSPWSVLLNLAVIPLMGILLPCLIGLQLVARLTALAHCLELPQHLLCAAIEAIFSCYEQLCRFTTALPGSILHTGYPTWQALAVYTIGLIALAVSGKKLRPHLRLAAAVCLMGIFLIRLPGELNVTMLDVGQGECVGIETREHHVYLVDAGSTSKKKTGQYQIIPWLKYIGTRSVEGIFITHWDEDHISAVGELLEWSKSSRVKIRRIFLPDVALKDEVLETLLQQIEEANVSVEYLSAGEHMTDGALQISCLHPYAKKVPEDRNDASLVLRLSQGDFQMLLTGDLEKSGEDWLVEQARPAVEQPQPVGQEQALPCAPSTRPAGQGQALPCAPSTRPAGQEQALPCAPSTQSAAQNSLRCTILDAGHHGASNATGEALLDLAQPELVLISCGKNNRYGHPAPETLKRLEERGIRWYSTAEVGAIQVHVGKKKVKIETSTSFSK